MDIGITDIDDLLVCGSCQRNFPLGNIVNFVQHKKFDCADVIPTGLMCQSCPRQFGTPWSLMEHAQNVHALKIYLETGPFPSGIIKEQSALFKRSNVTDSFCDTENITSNPEMLPYTPQQSVNLNGAVALMLNDSVSCGLQVLSACSVDYTAQDQFSNSELMQSSVCRDLSENFENISPKEYVDDNKLMHISGDLAMQTVCTEDPGQTPVLEKCCSTVLPKKRRRHVEIMHNSSRKRVPIVSSGPTSIYIDLEPGAESDSFQASLSHDTVPDPLILPESESSNMQQPTFRRHSVIIQPGVTFSIPVSCESVSLAPSFNYPIVADSETVHDTGSQNQTSIGEGHLRVGNLVDSGQPTAADAVTYHPDQELATCLQKNSNDQSSHNVLVGEEQGCGKTLENKRSRYPTSRPFKCDQCDNAFNQRIHLRKHQSKHTGVKPFKCDQCDYSTVERSHLKVHIRVHTGEKPYKCTYCEYATAQNSTLKIHLRRHHHGPISTESAQPSAAYVCEKCGQQFEERDTYQCHDAEQHTTTSSVPSSDQAATDDSDHIDSHS